MAWIESHQSLRTHRKTGRLARALGISKVTAIGHLHCLWWWCMDNAPDGDLTGIDAEDIAEGSEWEGDPHTFYAALAYAGFVDEERTIHSWYDYAGKLIERRRLDAARKRQERHKDGAETSAPPPAPVQRTSDGRRADGVRTVPNPTVPNPTQPNQEVNAPPGDAPPAAASVRDVPKSRVLSREQQSRFDRWYGDYPNRQHRPEAERAWRKLDPDDALTERIIADSAKRGLGRKWAEGFIELPATYLNKRVWEDDIEPVRMPSRASPNGKVNPVDAMAALARQFREEEARESRDVSGALDATFTVRAASH